ncbi:MAG: hypothetical protein ED556_12860 [Winogradskyella sp.]|uniref:hypothetical protein n=1 Tax=Winogradskyella sp. TaxID=1883156 RepID=UPI000F415651|nr:hypothetical protein [Winogradskyella sp.]RNC83441.1 MAG: hypothetical protein ED556_12860 [Winogradskyella sp.]
MPANKKHLSSPGQRFLKITAGIIGGFIVTILFHNAIGVLITDKGPLIMTTAYTSFILWAALMILAFVAKNGWKIWGIYLLLIIVFALIIFKLK